MLLKMLLALSITVESENYSALTYGNTNWTKNKVETASKGRWSDHLKAANHRNKID